MRRRSAREPAPIRRSLLIATTGTTIIAVVIIAVPLAIERMSSIRDDARTALTDQATALALSLERRLEDGRPVDASVVAARLLPDTRATVEVPDGTVEAGGPLDGPTLTASSPLVDNVQVTLSTDASATGTDQRNAVLVVVGVAAAALLGAAYVGVVLDRRLARPIEALAVAAAAAGQGDITARTPRSGIREIDEVAQAMDTTLARLGARLTGERQLSNKVAHQLRNSLTALRLQAEVAALTLTEDRQRAAIDGIVAQIDRLDETIRDLTEAARGDVSGEAKRVTGIVDDAIAFWRPSIERAGRAIEVNGDSGRGVDVGPARQAIDVLVENSLRHGKGAVRVALADRDGHVVIAVEDDGPGIPEGMERAVFDHGVTASATSGSGQGLTLARDVLQSHGGRLELTRARPPRFEIWLPGRDVDA